MLSTLLNGFRGFRNAIALGLLLSLSIYVAGLLVGARPLHERLRGQCTAGVRDDGPDVFADVGCAWSELDATGRLIAVTAVAALVGYAIAAVVEVAAIHAPFLRLADQPAEPARAKDVAEAWRGHGDENDRTWYVVPLAVVAVLLVYGAWLAAITMGAFVLFIVYVRKDAGDVALLRKAVDADGQAARIVLGVRALVVASDCPEASAVLDQRLGCLAAGVVGSMTRRDGTIGSCTPVACPTTEPRLAGHVREWLLLEARRRPTEALAVNEPATSAYGRADVLADAAELRRAAAVVIVSVVVGAVLVAHGPGDWPATLSPAEHGATWHDPILQTVVAGAMVLAVALNEAARSAERRLRGDVAEALLAHGIPTPALGRLLELLDREAVKLSHCDPQRWGTPTP